MVRVGGALLLGSCYRLRYGHRRSGILLPDWNISRPICFLVYIRAGWVLLVARRLPSRRRFPRMATNEIPDYSSRVDHRGRRIYMRRWNICFDQGDAPVVKLRDLCMLTVWLV